MLFADGERLYLYWGCSPTSGIWGCELDPENPCRAITPAKRLVAYDPKGNPWERFPNKPFGFVEGAWAFKRNGTYYLMFAAGGTEYPTYATGVARATSPLGDFVLQENNPVFFSPTGAVTGTAPVMLWTAIRRQTESVVEGTARPAGLFEGRERCAAFSWLDGRRGGFRVARRAVRGRRRAAPAAFVVAAAGRTL